MKKIVVFLAMLLLLTGCYEYSIGERVGMVTKFSKKGLFWKTWEGQMILGGEGASAMGEGTWDFSVEDSELIETIKQAKLSRKIIALEYREELVIAPWRGETDYMITKIIKSTNKAID